MPILKNAKKALRVSKRKAVVNSRIKSRIKTAIDAFKKSPSLDALSTAYSAVDVAVKKNVIKKNKAARVKRQLSQMMPQGAMATTKTAKKSVARKAAAKK